MLTCVSSKYSSESSNTRAFFDRCEIRCTLAADPGAKNVWRVRPWRPFASLVFIDTAISSYIAPQGRRESGTRGPNSDPQLHDPHTHLLSPVAFLAGIDHWNPEGIP